MAMTNSQARIGAIYVGYFDRAADPSGLDYWAGQLDNGVPLTSIAQSFSVQPEATALYPFLTHPTLRDAADFVVAIYRNLFNREVDDASLAFWVFELGLSRQVGPMILNIISGALHADLLTINNKTTIAVEYAQAFESAHRAWTPGDLASSRSVLSGVTSDPSSVTAAEAKIHDIVGQTLTLPPAASTMHLVAAGDAVMLDGTDGTIALTGADLAAYPAATYGTADKVISAGLAFVDAVAGATLDASANSAATSFDFGTGAVSGSDPVNAKLKYLGFTSYVASANGDTVATSASGQNVTGGAGADIIKMGVGLHAVTGGGGGDTFTVGAGTATISDLGAGGVDILVESGGAVSATLAANWTASSATNVTGGTVNVDVAGFHVSLGDVGGSVGWTLTNSRTGTTMSGSRNADTMTGGTGNDIIVGDAGNDTITGGRGADILIGGTGVNTFGSANNLGMVGQGVGPTATTFGATLRAGDTISFWNGVDQMADFFHGKLDVTNGATSPTDLFAADTTAIGSAGQVYVAYGTWDGTQFTIAAAFNPDTASSALLVQGDGATPLNSPANTGWVILTGIASALAAADFV